MPIITCICSLFNVYNYHILEINISNYVNRTYTLKCVYYHSGGEVMEQKYLRAGIKELVNECSDIELLYLIRSLLTV